MITVFRCSCVSFQMLGDASFPGDALIFALRALSCVCGSSVKASRQQRCVGLSELWDVPPHRRTTRGRQPLAWRSAARRGEGGGEGLRARWGEGGVVGRASSQEAGGVQIPGAPRRSLAEHQDSCVSTPRLQEGLGKGWSVEWFAVIWFRF